MNDPRNLELLHLYIKNSSVHALNIILVFVTFLVARLYLYGLPTEFEFIAATLVGTVAALCMRLQRELYVDVSSTSDMTKKQYRITILRTMLYKLGYMLPWLIMVYWPLDGSGVSEHFLGFAFTFSAISLFVATGSYCFVLFLWDLLIQVSFCSYVLALSYTGELTALFAIALVCASSMAVSMGWKMYRSSIDLLQKNKELQRVIRVINRAQKSKDQFWSVISHEIRTPLNGVMGTMDFLRETDLSDKQKEYVSTVTDCSEAMLTTLNDVLDYSKMEAGKFMIYHEAFDLQQLVENTFKAFEASAKKKGLDFSLVIEKDVPHYMRGDAARIRQVLSNFCNNAIKFTKEGSVIVRISMQIQDNEVFMRFAVEDTGVGVSEQDQTRLFKKFSQLEDSARSATDGTGLGLAISAHLVKLMDGRIRVKSKVREGSVFCFTVPYFQAEAADINDSESVDISLFTEGGVHVLIVDDNTLNTSILEQWLETKDIQCTVLHSGQQAIDACMGCSFDIILMDINMPEMSGVEASRQIKDQSASMNKDTPIIAMTASAMPDQLELYKEAGMLDCIAKPMNKNTLYKVLSLYVSEIEPVEDKSPDGVNTIEHAIRKLEGELGLAFVQPYVKNSLDRVEALRVEVAEYIEMNDYKSALDSAHDLVTVSGMISMTETSKVAKNIESACVDEDMAEIHECIQLIDKYVKIESSLVNEALNSFK